MTYDPYFSPVVAYSETIDVYESKVLPSQEIFHTYLCTYQHIKYLHYSLEKSATDSLK